MSMRLYLSKLPSRAVMTYNNHGLVYVHDFYEIELNSSLIYVLFSVTRRVLWWSKINLNLILPVCYIINKIESTIVHKMYYYNEKYTSPELQT